MPKQSKVGGPRKAVSPLPKISEICPTALEIMSAQFAMVEELAFLVKDNLPCKHLVLSMEESFINFLQDDSSDSSDGVLELEPLNSYNRLILHRLADIFGFSHGSIGEGEDRHLVLERCPETSIPSILVSDILWQYDEPEAPTMSRHLLTREESEDATLVSQKTLSLHPLSLKEREEAYSAARERIFAEGGGETCKPVREKPRTVPVVARRMIAHALGQRVHSPERQSENTRETASSLVQNTDVYNKTKNNNEERTASVPSDNARQDEAKNRTMKKVYSRDEQLGAAKRLITQALGLRSPKNDSLSKCNERKPIDKA